MCGGGGSRGRERVRALGFATRGERGVVCGGFFLRGSSRWVGERVSCGPLDPGASDGDLSAICVRGPWTNQNVVYRYDILTI